MKSATSLINYESQSLIANTHDNHIRPSSTPVFILCDRCYWCATYLRSIRILTDNICPQCDANSNQLTSFPIASNEAFIFKYDEKRGVELEFKDRRSL
jgi:hypothetical protein